MYTISNRQQKEIIQLLSALKNLSGNDNKTFNIKRCAGLMIKRLGKSKHVKHKYKEYVQL